MSGPSPSTAMSAWKRSRAAKACSDIRMFSRRLNWMRTLAAESVLEAWV